MARLGITGMVVLVALVVGGCSDDGVPANESDGTNVTGSASDASTGDTGGTSMSSTASSTITSEGDTTIGTSADSGSGGSGDASSGGSGSESGGMPSSCMTDDDCVLVEDCCTCGAIANGQEAPQCDQPECDQTACMAAGLQLPGVHCELGFCQLDEQVECNPVGITCDSKPPTCDEGFLPGVARGCWTGFCVPIDACTSVGSCDDCPQDQTCVELQAFTITYTCSPIPTGCGGTPSCACMGEVCEDPFTECGETRTGIGCGCPTC